MTKEALIALSGRVFKIAIGNETDFMLQIRYPELPHRHPELDSWTSQAAEPITGSPRGLHTCTVKKLTKEAKPGLRNLKPDSTHLVARLDVNRRPTSPFNSAKSRDDFQ